MLGRQEYLLKEDTLDGWVYVLSNEAVDGFQPLSHRMPSSWPFLREAYTTHHLRTEMIVKVWLRANADEPQYFVAIFEHACFRGRGELRGQDFDLRDVDSSDDEDSLVFVPVVKGLEHSEGVVEGMWTLIRLKKFDDLQSLFGDTLDLFAGLSAVPEAFLCADREGNLGVVVGGRVRANLGKLPCDHIQRRAHAVSNVARDHAKSGRGRVDDLDPSDIARAIRIAINDKFVWFGPHEEHPDFVLESVKMLLRPLKFEIGSVEWIHEVNYGCERSSQAEDPEGLRESLSPSARTFDTVLDAVAKPKKRSTVKG